MKLLLDTHLLLWAEDGIEHLPANALALISRFGDKGLKSRSEPNPLEVIVLSFKLHIPLRCKHLFSQGDVQ